jgi:hypothetical protein
MFNYDHNYRNHYQQPARVEAKLSATNFLRNVPWGDHLMLPKPDNIFRTYYQNVNGIKLDEFGGEFNAICSTTKELECDLVGFCETKLDTLKYPVRKILSTVFKKQFRNHHYAAATSSVPFEG